MPHGTGVRAPAGEMNQYLLELLARERLEEARAIAARLRAVPRRPLRLRRVVGIALVRLGCWIALGAAGPRTTTRRPRRMLADG